MIRKVFYLVIFITFLSLPLAQSAWHPGYQHSEPVSTPRTVFVHLFEWQWEDIAQECESFLGPKGFSAVQISPPNEHVVLASKGYPWWQRYQPVSYQIQSRSGDRAQFTDMVNRCRAVGVDIYADAVINHMSAEQQGVGSAGTSFVRYNYPGLYQPENFHACRHNVKSYLNHDEVTNCELSGLPDLNTGSDYVRKRLADYLIDLSRLGVSGFRIDAAKHIKTQDVGAILSRVREAVEPDPRIMQEVIDPGTEAVRKSEYYEHGAVYEFEYGKKVGEKFLGHEGQTLSQLETLGERWGLAPSDKAIVFIDNHDKQRGHGGGGTYLTHKDGRLYELANIFMLAHPYGSPQLMSSYSFTNSDQGPPSDENGQTKSVYANGVATCFSEWQCEHRWQAIANMVRFRNSMVEATDLTHWWSNGKNQIAFGRGNQGFVVINRESSPLTYKFQTGMASGTYCNVVQADFSAEGTCSGQAIAVDRRGQATITVDGMSAAAIYSGAKLAS